MNLPDRRRGLHDDRPHRLLGTLGITALDTGGDDPVQAHRLRLGDVRHQRVPGAAGQHLGHHLGQTGEHRVARGQEQGSVEVDVVAEVFGVIGRLGRRRHADDRRGEGATLGRGRSDGGELGRQRFDGRAQLG